MAQHHEITVLTHATTRPLLQPWLEACPTEVPVPRFCFLPSSRLAGVCRRWFPAGAWWGYQLWQRAARAEIARLQRACCFDLLHHASWATFRSTPAVWGQGVPVVWGPITGAAGTPWRFLPWRWPGECAHETVRNLSNRASRRHLARAGRACAAILVSTREMQQTFAAAGVPARLVPETGFAHTPFPQPRPLHQPLRLLFSGRFIFCKGLHFALHALRATDTRAELHLFGDGPLRRGYERLSRQLGLAGRVFFHGWKPREQLLATLADYDVFLFPSLHDGTASALLEAMAAGMPVVCLDCAGPGVVVTETCGRKVPVGTFKEIVRGLAAAVSAYERDDELRQLHGRGAWERVHYHYDWAALGKAMDAVYREAARGQP